MAPRRVQRGSEVAVNAMEDDETDLPWLAYESLEEPAACDEAAPTDWAPVMMSLLGGQACRVASWLWLWRAGQPLTMSKKGLEKREPKWWKKNGRSGSPCLHFDMTIYSAIIHTTMDRLDSHPDDHPSSTFSLISFIRDIPFYISTQTKRNKETKNKW